MVFWSNSPSNRILEERILNLQERVYSLERTLATLPVRVLTERGEPHWTPQITVVDGVEIWVRFDSTLIDPFGNVLVLPGEDWHQVYNVVRCDINYAYNYQENIPRLQGWICLNDVWWKIISSDIAQEWQCHPDRPDYNIGWEEYE